MNGKWIVVLSWRQNIITKTREEEYPDKASAVFCAVQFDGMYGKAYVKDPEGRVLSQKELYAAYPDNLKLQSK